MDDDAFWEVCAHDQKNIGAGKIVARNLTITATCWPRFTQVEMLNADELAVRTGRSLDELAPNEQEPAGASHSTFGPATWYTHPLQVNHEIPLASPSRRRQHASGDAMLVCCRAGAAHRVRRVPRIWRDGHHWWRAVGSCSSALRVNVRIVVLCLYRRWWIGVPHLTSLVRTTDLLSAAT